MKLKESLKECLRCATLSPVSPIGAALVHFVCDYCRRDNSDLHLGRDITVKDMERSMVESYSEIRKDNKHQTHDGY